MSHQVISLPSSSEESPSALPPMGMPPLPALGHMMSTGFSSLEIQATLAELARKAALNESKLVESAMIERMEKLAKDQMQFFKAEISKIEMPKPQVLAVKVNDGAIKKLSRPAPKYLPEMIENAQCGLSTMLVGPKGCGKSTAAEILSEAFGMAFGALSCSAGMSETWFMGRHVFNGYVTAPFVECYEFGGVFLIDEIDRADPNTLITINNALANGYFINPMTGKKIMKHKNFICVAGANTFGKGGDAIYTAANKLDGSTLDRFWPLEVDYDKDLEKQIVAKYGDDSYFLNLLWNARDRLRKLHSDETISTRKIIEAFALRFQAGRKRSAIVRSIVAGWPKEIVKSIGLDQVKDTDDDDVMNQAKPENNHDKEVAQELEKARIENEALKKKAFGRK